jgi:TetR/AcrR family transcriptional regulator, lmrAB and yxaGH operons repressor
VPTDSREQMLRAAAALFQERGYAATSFHDVIARSGAPRGSIYHHFPGGKEQLAAEALRWYAGRTSAALADATARGTAVEAVAGFVAASSDGLRRTDFRAGCPIAGVALDLAGPDQPLHAVVAAALADWRRVLAYAFERDGAAPSAARRLAALAVAAVEGALLLARADRDTRPLDDVGRELIVHLSSALAGSQRPSG